LPYWNYSASSNNARRIPPAFRAAKLPDGTDNPLRVTQRVPAANSGGIIAADTDVDIVDCLDEEDFIGAFDGANTGFGGPETAFNHNGGEPGKVEMTPHGDMHVAVGGVPPLPVGFMSRFHTAALDPLFWLHHANIDRLWNVWLKRRTGNTNPTKAQWLDQRKFEFHDELKHEVKSTTAKVVDSETSLFAYRYEDESDPLPSADEGEAERDETIMGQQPAEMVGATATKTVLRGKAVTARVPTQAPTGPAVESDADGGPRGRVYIKIENITGTDPVPHLVYINLPEGANPSAYPERLAGSMSMFGLPEASGEDPQHPGSGLTYSIDITGVAERLGADWSPKEVRVTLVPKPVAGVERDAVAAQADLPIVNVGRISVYLS
jgi:tyrosinase